MTRLRLGNSRGPMLDVPACILNLAMERSSPRRVRIEPASPTAGSVAARTAGAFGEHGDEVCPLFMVWR